MRASWVFAFSVPVALLLSGCHGPDAPDAPEVAFERDVPEAGSDGSGSVCVPDEVPRCIPHDGRPWCVPEHVSWPVPGGGNATNGLLVFCRPHDAPGFPTPDTDWAGPQITFWNGSDPMRVICIDADAECRPSPPPSSIERFEVPHTGTFGIRAKFANTGDRIMHLEPPGGCIRIRAWLDVRGQVVELPAADQDDWTCADAWVGRSVSPHEHEEWGLNYEFSIDPAALLARHEANVSIDGTYRLYAAFDSPTSTWNATGSAWVHIRDASDLPRVAVEQVGGAPDYRFDVRFRNTSNLTFLYTTPTSCGSVHATVEREGRQVSARDSKQGTYLCYQAFTRLAIPPGEIRTLSFEWDGRFGAEDAQPGTYTFSSRFGGEPLWDTTGTLDFVVP